MESLPEGEKKMVPSEGGSAGNGASAGAGGGAAGGETKTKRKMKTASQLELLEKTYAVETYPSESLRAELSAKLGLTDRQLQMWFCHRRLKDRKVAPTKRAKKEAAAVAPGVGMDEMMVGESGNEPGSGSGSGSSLFEARKVVVPRVPPAVARIGGDVPMVKRYYEPPPPQPLSELRAIAFVEAQLGEPIREDGPILGVEFDPLPPGAFGTPIGMTGQQPPIGRTYDSQFYERHDAKSIKTSALLPSMEHTFLPSSSGGKRKAGAGNVHVVHTPASARALHEYQFLPEQPSVRSDTYERAEPSHCYSSAIDTSSSRPSLSSGGTYLHGKEQMTTGYGFQGQVSSVSHLSQQGRQGQAFPSLSVEYETVPHRSTFTNSGLDAQIGSHPVVGMDNPFISSERRVCHDEDPTRMERKRKNEEARIAKEVEAHEKRIRKELERQDILRRKREEQMRREMERHDRERRKEEERLLREKQREEERFLREQRRELERREKFLQKENMRAEKMRQKEELRREKEAARQKAANERATARRIAKESMELIEDERLELMELAASRKGLPSIISLDSETLQNLELFRDTLCTFPPKSVQLKRPFAIQPWTDSEENVGNLLMVWRFLITFADVLELWPFTLDEFVQALHDYDPRLLSEIHVALLRSIIKDIEDVARTPSIGLGTSQTSSANPGGGHPQIVEGAYAWGFDICSWQRHLNSLTWPEILRQFALSAGFGPQLKKRSIERAYLRDDNEGHDGEDIVTTLRNGAAAENAVAVMQEKGFSHPRRSRHRLTPGTVKFAAFHVLSLEGSKGLTILEVADRIQKSGLRDLTTSKTPEASIAAALSRDSNLFERTAPSTYCVRPAFRKDPADAEAILSAAREKIQIFENGFSDSEDGEKDAEDADDVERDEDSDCDVNEDPEVDDVGLAADSIKEVCGVNESKAIQSVSCTGNGNRETLHIKVGESHQNEFTSARKEFSSFVLEGSKEVNSSGASLDQSIGAVANCNEPINTEQEDTEIDESNSGEPWVQGLTEGEYSDLSVEERLNALVALIGVAIEGNSIRVILEERLEAANSLKKQMWAEAQLDKRRLKEEYLTKLQYSYMGIKAEQNHTGSAVDGNQSPLVVDNKIGDASLDSASKQEPNLDSQNAQSYLNNLPAERTLLGQDSAGPDNFPHHHGHTAEKSRSQLKSYIGHKAEEMYVYRSLPLGQDRRRNRYWQFVASASRNDPGSGRIFVELQGGGWRLIDSEEAFDNLLASLDTRGLRESHLHSMLQKIEISFKDAVKKSSIVDRIGRTVKTEAPENSSSPDCAAGIESPGNEVDNHRCNTLEQSSSFRIELGRTQIEKNNAVRRYQDFQKWMWKECFNQSVLCAMKFGKKRCMELLATCGFCYDSYLSQDNHCPVCHRTFGSLYNNSSFSDHINQCREKQKSDCHTSNSSLPLRIRMLKAQLALVEVSIPPEALEPLWTEDYRNSWGVKLNASSSAEELLQFLTMLEAAIKRDHLSSNYETTRELLGSSVSQRCAVDTSSLPGSVTVLPWVPQTTPAVALRLMDLDASISYILNQKTESEKDKEDNELMRLPSRYNTAAKNIMEFGLSEGPDQAEYVQEDHWLDPAIGRSISGRSRSSRGRGARSSTARTRGGRLQRGIRSETGKEIAGGSEKSGRRLGRRSQSRGRGGRRRGSRSVRSRPRSNKNVVGKEMHLGRLGVLPSVPVPKQNNIMTESSRHSGALHWVSETRRAPAETGENSNSAETLGSDDNEQASGDEYDDGPVVEYGRIFNKSEDLMEESDEEVDEEGEEDNEVDEDGDEEVGVEGDDDGEMMMDGDMDGDENIIINDDGEGVDDDDDDDDGEGIGDEDAISSGSSDYSD